MVILTTSRSEEEVLRSYELAADCFITKPVDLDQFVDAIRRAEDPWLGLVTLPLRW